MDNRLYLNAPLEIEGWEIVETLEHLTLFCEFRERIEDALELIQFGQKHWQGHMHHDGEWSVLAMQTVAEVRCLAYNIWQSFQRSSDDLARCIRWSVGLSSADSSVTDSQCVAALAMDRACRAIETLARWLEGFDAELYGTNPGVVAALAEEAPDHFEELLTALRQEGAMEEMEARESAADLLGTARHYMTLADVYASPLLSSTEKVRISAAASKAGRNSVAVRQEAVAARNANICSHGRRLLDGGKSEREIVGIIAGTDSALKKAGGTDRLSKKQIRNILVAGGVLPEK
ncbi:hypothetical protein ACM7ZU_12400 [Pseudomonas aeruginosa]